MGLLPGRPDGNADQLRRGAQAWDDAAHAIWQMANQIRPEAQVSSWWRSEAASAYQKDWDQFIVNANELDRHIHAVSTALRDAATHVEWGQHAYDIAVGTVTVATVAGLILTPFTLGGSDAAAAEVDAEAAVAASTVVATLQGLMAAVRAALAATLQLLENLAIRLTVQFGPNAVPAFVGGGGGAAVGFGTAWAAGERDPAALTFWTMTSGADGYIEGGGTAGRGRGRADPAGPDPGVGSGGRAATRPSAIDAPDAWLGRDPAHGNAFNQSEYDTARRLQQQLGITLKRDPSGITEWFDAANPSVTYDAIGTDLRSQDFDKQWGMGNIQTAITDHLAKAKFVPIEVSGLTPAQASTIESWVRENSRGSNVIFVGTPGG